MEDPFDPFGLFDSDINSCYPNEYLGLFGDTTGAFEGDFNFDFGLSTTNDSTSALLNPSNSLDEIGDLEPSKSPVPFSSTIAHPPPSSQGNLESHSDVVISSDPNVFMKTVSAPLKAPTHPHRPKSSSQKDENQTCERKRKWEDSIIVFSAHASEDDVSKTLAFRPRNRKAFTQTRKKEVALNRLLGACIQCKLRKMSCTFGIPCNHCIKRVGDISLGQEICGRKNLLSTRFDCVDLLLVARREHVLQSLKLPDIEEAKNYIYVGYPPRDSAHTSEAFLKLPIIDIDSSAYPHTSRLITFNYFRATLDVLLNPAFAIQSSALPSVDELLKIYRISEYKNACNGPFTDLRLAFVVFAERYSSSSHQLPLQALIRKTFRVQELFDIFATSFRTLEPETAEGFKFGFAPSAVGMQLRTIVADEIIKLEVEILSNIDKLVLSYQGIGRSTPVAVWVCLCGLIFTYHEHMIYCEFSHPERTELYHLSRHLYNNLISIYSALYRTTSPSILDWRTDEIAELLGKDPELIRLFGNIKTEMFWFQAAKFDLKPADGLFKSLILDHENKLRITHIKAAKRSGAI